jgi:hypothetical protein
MQNIILNIEIFTLSFIVLTYLFFGGIKKMKKKRINRYIGEKCKILYKEPGEINIHIRTGIIRNINKLLGIIKIESHNQKYTMKINNILTINPIHKKGLF